MHIQKSSEASKVEMLFRTRAPTFISFVKKKKKENHVCCFIFCGFTRI